MNRALSLSALGLGAVLLAGCSSPPKPESQFPSAAISAAPGANNDSAIPVDVVLVYDSVLTPDLLKLSAADWFAQRDQFQRDHAAGIAVVSWEVVPGQAIKATLPQKQPAWTAFVYADYANPGAHRARIDQGGALTIALGAADVVVTGAAAAGK